MKPQPLDYAPASASWFGGKALRRLGWAILIVVAFGFVPEIFIRQELGWIDSVSGSRKEQTVWRFGWSTNPVVIVSPLETRFRELGLRWQPNWCNVKGTYKNVFGANRGSGHGPAPEVYYLAFHPEVQQAFIQASTDDELRAFFRVMSTGTEAEQRSAVEAVFDAYFRSQDSEHRAGEATSGPGR